MFPCFGDIESSHCNLARLLINWVGSKVSRCIFLKWGWTAIAREARTDQLNHPVQVEKYRSIENKYRFLCLKKMNRGVAVIYQQWSHLTSYSGLVEEFVKLGNVDIKSFSLSSLSLSSHIYCRFISGWFPILHSNLFNLYTVLSQLLSRAPPKSVRIGGMRHEILSISRLGL